LKTLKNGLRVLLAMIIGAVPAHAQAPSSAAALVQAQIPSLRVAVVVVPPFIMEQNGSLAGFNIELWNAIASELKVKTIYQLEPDASSLLGAIQSRSADLTVAPIVITSARDELFDFSYPTMELGLQVMVRSTGQATQTKSPLRDMLRLMFSQTTLLWLGMALVLALIPAHLVWLFERGHQDGAISSTKYFPGIFQAMFWAASTLTTQAEAFPRQWLVRALSLFWMFVGVVFVAFYTAQLTTTLTVEQIRGAIEGPGDLPGKQVATIAHSPAADSLREQNAQVVEFSTPDLMFQALLDKKVDAVVFTAPVLRYYETHQGKGLVNTVGPEFDTSPIAIMVPLNSPLRRPINATLLKLRENGTYQQIFNKWFGGQ